MLIRIDLIFRGLGAIIGRKFAAEGCNVAINYNASKERAEQVVANIVEKHKVKSISIGGVSIREHLLIRVEY